MNIFESDKESRLLEEFYEQLGLIDTMDAEQYSWYLSSGELYE